MLMVPTWVMLSPILLIMGAAYFSAWFFRDTCDFKKSCFLYFPLSAVIVFVFLFFGLDAVLGIVMAGVGFFALMHYSNRVFYKHSNDINKQNQKRGKG